MPLSPEMEKEVVSRYLKGEPSGALAKEFGYKRKESICHIVKKHGYDPKSIYLHHQEDGKTYKDFSMEYVDSQFKAYFLGLMLTDGYISGKRNTIGLDLTDEDAISFVASGINCTYSEYPSYDRLNGQTNYRIYLHSDKLKSDFCRLGVIPFKSKTLEGPILTKEENEFIPYILRGIIDGDGWVRKDGKEFYICSASTSFLEWCKEQLITLGFEKLEIRYGQNGVYTLRTAIKKNISILKEKIYDKPYGMARKYNKLYQ